MTKSFLGGLSIVLAGVALLAAPAHAQMTRSTFESLTVPGQDGFPENRWQNVKYINVWNFDYFSESSADYGRVLFPENTQSNNPDNVWYATIFAPQNAKVVITPYFDAAVPPGTWINQNGSMVWADDCYHAHFGYSAFTEVSVYNGSEFFVYYTLRASEGRVGHRYDFVNGVYQPVAGTGNPDLPCYVTSTPDDGGPRTSYTWTNNIDSLNPATFVYSQNGSSIVQIPRIHFAIQAATHGWGDCGAFQCFPQVAIAAFRTQ